MPAQFFSFATPHLPGHNGPLENPEPAPHGWVRLRRDHNEGIIDTSGHQAGDAAHFLPDLTDEIPSPSSYFVRTPCATNCFPASVTPDGTKPLGCGTDLHCRRVADPPQPRTLGRRGRRTCRLCATRRHQVAPNILKGRRLRTSCPRHDRISCCLRREVHLLLHRAYQFAGAVEHRPTRQRQRAGTAG